MKNPIRFLRRRFGRSEAEKWRKATRKWKQPPKGEKADDWAIYDVPQFFLRTQGGRPSQLDMVPYTTATFECACGATHVFLPRAVRVLRELSGMRVVFACPEHGERFVTCVKIKGVTKFKGFQSLFGGEQLPAAE